MLQDIAPHCFDNRFAPEREATDDSPVCLFAEDRLRAALAGPEGRELRLPRRRDLPDGTALRHLFAIDGENFFLAEGGAALPPPFTQTFAPLSLRHLRKIDARPRHLVFAAHTALHLARWYADNRFCGRCGGATAHAADERALLCPACGHRIYPRIAPAVIVAVTDGERLLLTKYRDRPGLGYVLIAGFVEIGETLEECVAREEMEEVGLAVTDIRYFASQPWGLAGDILAGFFCAASGEPVPDGRELKEARWISRADIPEQRDDYSLTSAMIRAFREGRERRCGEQEERA